MRVTKVMAKNIKVGDFFEDEEVVETKLTDKGNVIITLISGAWRRRPAGDKVEIGRL